MPHPIAIKPAPTRQEHIPLSKEYTYLFYPSIHEVPEGEWEKALPSDHFFLCYNYLKCVEDLKADQNYFRYIIVYKSGKPVGVVYFQITDFTANLFGKLIEAQFDSLSKNRLGLFRSKLEKHNRSTVMRLLTCGNNYVSGEHGFLFDRRIPRTEQFDVLENLVKAVASKEKLRGRISGMLIKDFYAPLPLTRCLFGSSNYLEFKVEPSMVVTIPGTANTLPEYLACFSKKYRNRAKGILKASETLEWRELEEDEIQARYSELFELYENVYNNAKFKLAKLDATYFHEMKKLFGERFRVHGCFRDGKLVSFLSAIVHGHELEAHYIGFDYHINKEYELYQNILYRNIAIAMELGIKQVNLGRTASEIKSTVGAKAHDLYCYIRPQNALSRLILRPFVSFLQPSEWVPRNPFKEE